MSKKQRILVIGLGRFGSALAGALTDAGHEVVAVDLDMEKVEDIKHRVAFAMQLDATEPPALQSVDAAQCAVAIVSMGDAFEAAALAVVAVKELGVPRIVARARSHQQAKILAAIGATRVVELEAEMAKQVARDLDA